MKAIKKNYISEFKERGSTFTGILFPCKSEEDFDSKLQKIRKEYWDASHHCYAYRIDPERAIEFSSDDGEPGGTAGLPILNQLKSEDLIDVGAIVIRYFGGTKLGKPGLIEAYGSSIKICIDKAELKKILRVKFFEVEYAYDQENLLNKLVLDFQLIEQSADYSASVKKQFACPLEISEKFEKELISLEHLDIKFDEYKTGYVFT